MDIKADSEKTVKDILVSEGDEVQVGFYRRGGEAGLDKRASGRYNKSSGAIREKR